MGKEAEHEQRLADFTGRLNQAEKRWLAAMAPYKGTKMVTYHRSLPNFAERFGLDIVGYVEPRPGIPPTPQHTLDLINEMKRQNVKLVLVEPYFDLKTPNAIGRSQRGDRGVGERYIPASQLPAVLRGQDPGAVGNQGALLGPHSARDLQEPRIVETGRYIRVCLGCFNENLSHSRCCHRIPHLVDKRTRSCGLPSCLNAYVSPVLKR